MEIKTMLQLIKMDLEILSKDISKICSEGHSCKKCPFCKDKDKNICIFDDMNYQACLGQIQQKLRKIEGKEENEE